MERLHHFSRTQGRPKKRQKAKLAHEAKDLFAEEHYQECLNTLEGLKIMKERGVPESMIYN
jgi:hypothetical protein